MCICGRAPPGGEEKTVAERPRWLGPDEIGGVTGAFSRHGGAALDLAMAGQFGFDGPERADEQGLLISVAKGVVLARSSHRYDEVGVLDPSARDEVQAWITEASRGGAAHLRFVFRIDARTPWKQVRVALALVDGSAPPRRSLRFQFLPCLRDPVGMEAAIDAEPDPASPPDSPLAGVLAFEVPPRRGRPAYVRATWAGRSWDFPVQANAPSWDSWTQEDWARVRANHAETNRIWDELGAGLDVVARADPSGLGVVQFDVADGVEWAYVAQGLALALHAKATRIRFGDTGPVLRLRPPPPFDAPTYPDPFPNDPPPLLVILLGVTAAAALSRGRGANTRAAPRGQPLRHAAQGRAGPRVRQDVVATHLDDRAGRKKERTEPGSMSPPATSSRVPYVYVQDPYVQKSWSPCVPRVNSKFSHTLQVAVLVARRGEPEALHVVVLDLQADAAARARVPGQRTRGAPVVAGEGAVGRGVVDAGADRPRAMEAPHELGVAAPVLVRARRDGHVDRPAQAVVHGADLVVGLVVAEDDLARPREQRPRRVRGPREPRQGEIGAVHVRASARPRRIRAPTARESRHERRGATAAAPGELVGRLDAPVPGEVGEVRDVPIEGHVRPDLLALLSEERRLGLAARVLEAREDPQRHAWHEPRHPRALPAPSVAAEGATEDHRLVQELPRVRMHRVRATELGQELADLDLEAAREGRGEGIGLLELERALPVLVQLVDDRRGTR